MNDQIARSWDDSYRGLPAWYELDTKDLARFVRDAGVPLNQGGRVLDLGAGDGRRIMEAILSSPDANRSDLHVTCVDVSPRAVAQGIERWKSLSRSVCPDGATPRWSMEFRVADASSLPQDLLCDRWDVVIDWMLLHGVQADHRDAYLAQLRSIDTDRLLLKCFTAEHGTLAELPETIPGVVKSQFTDRQIAELLGPGYSPAEAKMDWPEDLNPRDHSDGPIAAKRAYCFRRGLRSALAAESLG